MRNVVSASGLMLLLATGCSSSTTTTALGVGGAAGIGGTGASGGRSTVGGTSNLTSAAGNATTAPGGTTPQMTSIGGSGPSTGASAGGGGVTGTGGGVGTGGALPIGGSTSVHTGSSTGGSVGGGVTGVGGVTTGGIHTGGSPTVTGGAGGKSAVGTGGVSGSGTTAAAGGTGPISVDECLLGTHTCDANASCKDLPVGYQCTCLTGFVGDGHTCRNCAIKNGGCDALTTCSAVGNTIVCGPCPTGYKDTNGDGTLCTDIDECKEGTSGCDPNANCTNTLGSVSCTCPTGWSGNGKSCVAGIKSISTTGSTNCALKYDGNVWCWGTVAFGPSPAPNPVPLKVTTLAGWDSFYWEQTRCGIRSGALYCWGNNNWGSAGLGSTSTVDTPTQVGTQTDWTMVSGNASTTCGIRAGQLYCWGYTQGLRTGDPQAQNYTTPQQWSALSGWQSVSVWYNASCGIRAGALYCWGAAYGYTLGDGTTEESPTPVRVGTDSDWSVADFGAAIRSGQLYTWGDNNFGKVGNGSYGSGVYQKTPTRIGLAADWSSVSGFAQNYSCGVRGGIGFCWGNNNDGELGIGSVADPVVPTQVALDVNWQRIQGGGSSSCGIADYKVYCWGSNNFGQVGDGTTETRQSPVAVVFR